MKLTKSILAASAFTLISSQAFAFFVYDGVDASLKQIAQNNGTPLGDTNFTLKIGYFDYSPTNFALNNAGIIADQASLAALTTHFQTLFTFDGSTTPANEPAGAGVYGEFGTNVGGPGFGYANRKETDATITGALSGFSNKIMYAWFQMKLTPTEYGIFADGVTKFNNGSNPLDALSIMALDPSVNTVPVVGSFAASGNAGQGQYRLAVVPEPTSMALLTLGAALVGLRRRRA